MKFLGFALIGILTGYMIGTGIFELLKSFQSTRTKYYNIAMIIVGIAIQILVILSQL